MSTRKLSILLLLALLAINSFAIDMDEHKCTHDSMDNPEPEFMDMDEDYNADGENEHEGRTLASYPNLRFYTQYELGGSSTANQNYFRNSLVPPIVSYFQSALHVKYPVSGLWKTSAGSVCGYSTPSALRSGVNADFVFFVKTDTSSSYVANTYTCNLASGTSRPLAGRTTISTRFMSATTDVLKHEKNMICMMHELTHALGFATSLYKHFLNSAGKKLSGHILSKTLDGAKATVINVAPLTNRLRSFYGCSSLAGAYMENSGSSATAGSHFERKIFTYEMMTSGLVLGQQVSQFTLALLEGSGWYVPDYSYADIYSFGQGQGCNFMTQKCPSTQFSEYCSGSTRQCTVMGRGAGGCSSDTRADNCKWVIANQNYDCDNSNAKNYARLPSLQSFGRGQNSKCFTGTLNSGKNAGASTSFCFKGTCSVSNGKYTLNLNVGGKTVACTAKGNKSVSGYAGVINCPDPAKWCTTVGAKVCPRNCMGRGTCVNGVCQCKSGKGVDCSAP